MQNIFPTVPPVFNTEAQVWLAWTDRFSDSNDLEICRSLLTNEELQRYEKFYFERDRHLFLVSHAMLRYVLAACLQTEPGKIELKYNAYGRPEVDRRLGMQNIRFNLSHTPGLAAMVLNYDYACGIDVEAHRDLGNIIALSDSVLTTEERNIIFKQPVSDRVEAFLRIWTLKEAYIKALGKGLAHPLNEFGFDVGEEVDIRFHADCNDDSRLWQFSQRQFHSTHVLALAIRHNAEAALAISFHEWDPKRSD